MNNYEITEAFGSYQMRIGDNMFFYEVPNQIINVIKNLEAELKLRENALKREHEAIHRANDLEEKLSLLNKMNEENYEKYCNELKKNRDVINYIKSAKELDVGTTKSFSILEFPFVQHILEILGSDNNE